MIAEVIVDVAAYPIDRPFDYAVPAHFHSIIERGMRVKVPFGRRTVLGYVVALKETTEVPSDKLKNIAQVVDLEPVFSTELLQLARWLAKDTICYEIDALQVMLPAAMRAKYVKYLTVVDAAQIVDPALQKMFLQKTTISLKQLTDARLLPAVKQAMQAGAIEMKTAVTQQTNVKKERWIQIADGVQLQRVLQSLPNNAKKQLQLVQWMLEHENETIKATDLLQASAVQHQVLKAVLEKGAGHEFYEETYRQPEAPRLKDTPIPLELTTQQQQAYTQLINAIDQQKDETFLLHGVTGSGKTEVYLRAIHHVLQQGKEAIVLVPEIALTPQMTARFQERFGQQVAVMHSGLSAGEKYDEWRKIHRREVKVVVGARSAIFAPFQRLGLIILDEEHESTYKQEENPKYHARDVAIWRARHHQCPVVLGSATPSLESYARASKGVYSLLTLSQRAKQSNLPVVHTVDMREELKKGNRSMFSSVLMEAIRQRLAAKEQIVLFLNKRGFSSFVLCRDCGTVIQCPYCDISLTYHRTNEQLKCHYCQFEEIVPHQCPECASEHIRFFGTGTQKAEEELAKIVPEARILRMDVDTTRKKGAHERLLRHFSEHKSDILLGTQMIAKGLDFPSITLVGVLAADTTLYLPDFRAAEKTFQLLTQVSGRAGRHELPGEVFIQTYSPEHYAIQHAKTQHYESFYQVEMMARKQYHYPPFYYITIVQFAHEDVLKAAEFAQKGTQFMQSNVSPNTIVIGPVASAISRLNNRYRYHCLIKYKKDPQLQHALHALNKIYRTDWIKSGLILSIDQEPTTIL